MVGGSCIVYCTPPFLPHVILLEKNLSVGGNVCPICFARAVCTIDPTRPANAVPHGLWQTLRSTRQIIHTGSSACLRVHA